MRATRLLEWTNTGVIFIHWVLLTAFITFRRYSKARVSLVWLHQIMMYTEGERGSKQEFYFILHHPNLILSADHLFLFGSLHVYISIFVCWYWLDPTNEILTNINTQIKHIHTLYILLSGFSCFVLLLQGNGSLYISTILRPTSYLHSSGVFQTPTLNHSSCDSVSL